MTKSLLFQGGRPFILNPAPASEIITSHMNELTRIQTQVNDCSTRGETAEHFDTFSTKMELNMDKNL